MNGMMAVTKKEQVRIIAGLFSPAGVIAAVRRLDIRIIHAILAAVLLIAVTGIGGRMIIANASVKEGQNALERYYTSITIEDCDTLWDIEARYNTGAENKEQYIRSIMQMNHMSSDILYSGQNLIITEAPLRRSCVLCNGIASAVINWKTNQVIGFSVRIVYNIEV